MIKIELVKVYGMDAAIRGMRNPMNSWEKSDSYWTHLENPQTMNEAPFQYCVGEEDLALMRKLFRGGSDHRKFMRQIFVSMDITAPLYWWKEFDTYKVGTVANSCSTMHKAHTRDFVLDDFSTEKLKTVTAKDALAHVIDALNIARCNFMETKNKEHWDEMIQLIPSSYNQKRTVTMNYENAASMIRQRQNHKLSEWREFVRVLYDLPYLAEIMAG